MLCESLPRTRVLGLTCANLFVIVSCRRPDAAAAAVSCRQQPSSIFTDQSIASQSVGLAGKQSGRGIDTLPIRSILSTTTAAAPTATAPPTATLAAELVAAGAREASATTKVGLSSAGTIRPKRSRKLLALISWQQLSAPAPERAAAFQPSIHPSIHTFSV